SQPAPQPAPQPTPQPFAQQDTPGMPAASATGLVPDPMKSAAGAISPSGLSQLLTAISAAGFSDDKLALIRTSAASNHFTVSQTVSILEQLSFSSDQLEALALLRPRIIDPVNAVQLGAVFSFSSDRDEALRLFQ
ncbi:MAG: hypothetical protein ACI8RZ_000152, partial [Myxococcota bacterium]